MIEKLNKRKQEEMKVIQKSRRKTNNMVSDKELFMRMSKSIKWQKGNSKIVGG